MKPLRPLALRWFPAFGLLARCLADPVGLEELYRLDRLPAFKSAVKVGSISSYDRTGGNDDGFSGKYSFVRKDAEGLVLADLQGPGVIYRVWTPTPSDDVLEFLFDGEAAPRVSVKFRDLFLGREPGFPRPLVGFGAGGYWCYVPMPFAKSCLVRMRAPKVQFYQINYASFAPGTALTTFKPQRSADDQALCDKVCQLWRQPGADLSSLSAPPGAALQVTHTTLSLGARSTGQLFKAGQGGRIVGLRVWPAEAMRDKSRALLLRIAFDGEAPAVLCPLGDFFGYAWGEPAMRSLLVGTAGATNYCYFPMPFERSASVEVVADEGPGLELRAEIVSADRPRTADEGKFYAVWRRENPTRLGEPFTFIDTQGRGHLVGVVLQAQGLESGKTLFFEGDDQTTIDGELTIHGTGSEDFFNGGWYDVPDRWEKRISFPLNGCLGYLKPLGRTGAYRLFLGDAYAFRKSLRQTIEHSGEKNNILTDYVSVTYLYSEQRPTAGLELPPLTDRKVEDPKEAIFPVWWETPIHAWSFDRASLTRKMEKLGGEDVRFLSLTATNQDWFGPHFFSPACDLPAAGSYRVYLEAVKGPAQAKVQLFQNENPVADPVDLYAEERVKSDRVLLGRLELNAGRNNLMFKLVGKHEKATGLGLDLVNIVCVRDE
jgi:hypothetical protein